jgi:hypothetical protein
MPNGKNHTNKQKKQHSSNQGNSSSSATKSKVGFQTYSLDRYAHDLVYERKGEDVLNQSHKMRSTVAFGLERFWGEQFRLEDKEPEKAKYWKAVWTTLSKILQEVGIGLPNDAKNLWEFDREHRKIALAILTELCDCLIWWTQRYK